jgi:MFS family permease
LEWSTAEQARLFGATFYGSFFTVWFSGYLADRFGTKLLISLAIADYSLVSLFSPLFVSINYNVFFAARIFMGFGEVLAKK